MAPAGISVFVLLPLHCQRKHRVKNNYRKFVIILNNPDAKSWIRDLHKKKKLRHLKDDMSLRPIAYSHVEPHVMYVLLANSGVCEGDTAIFTKFLHKAWFVEQNIMICYKKNNCVCSLNWPADVMLIGGEPQTRALGSWVTKHEVVEKYTKKRWVSSTVPVLVSPAVPMRFPKDSSVSL